MWWGHSGEMCVWKWRIVMCERCFEGLGITSLNLLPGGREDWERNEWQEVRGKCSGNSIVKISAAIICFRRGTEAVVKSRSKTDWASSSLRLISLTADWQEGAVAAIGSPRPGHACRRSTSGEEYQASKKANLTYTTELGLMISSGQVCSGRSPSTKGSLIVY